MNALKYFEKTAFPLQVCPRHIADRVNLGLIPSSRDGWPVACEALKPESGGILHIHYNVNTKPTDSCCIQQCQNKVQSSGDIRGDTNEHNVERINVEPFLQEAKFIDIGDVFNTYSIKKGKMNIDNVLNCYLDKMLEGIIDSHELLISADQPKQNSSDLQDLGSYRKELYKRLETMATSKFLTWALQTSLEIKKILDSLDKDKWITEVHHIENVKSYAPHVDHVVLDLKCCPVKSLLL